MNRTLKEYIFIYDSTSFHFFHHHLKSTDGIAINISVKINWLARPLFIVPFFYFSGGFGMLSFRGFSEITGLHVLLKFSYGPCTRKPFAGKVMLSISSVFTA